jgi:branched-chain amino acid transport system permease protein
MKKEYSNILSLWLFVAVIGLVPFFITNPYYITIMVFIGIFSLPAVGLTLLMGYSGQISIGHAAFFGMGAYTSGILTTKLGLNPWAAMSVAIILTSLLALIIGIPALRLKGHYLAMATLGFGEITYILFNELPFTGGASGLGNIPVIGIGGFPFNTDQRMYYLVWCFVVLVLIFSLNFLRSRVGRALRSIRGNEMAASALAIPVAKYKIQVFVLGAIYASIGGSLYAHFVTFISPSSFSLWVAATFLAMIVVGGMTNIWGGILGAGLLTILQEVLRRFGDFDVIFYGLALILVMMFMPEGLFFGLKSLAIRLRNK